MKNLFTCFSNFWSNILGSQSSEVGFDYRLTVGSPSFDCRSAMLKLVSVLVLILTVGVGNVWGTGQAITLSNGSHNGTTKVITWTASNICTITQAPGGGQNETLPSSSYVSAPRWYKYNVITFTAASGIELNSVVVTCTSDSYATTLANSTYTRTGGTGSVSAAVGTGANTSIVTITCTGTVTAFTIAMGGQARLSAITVNYTTSTPASAYTVTFYKTDGSTQAITEASAGAGVTPPTMQATCDDWTFQGWSLSESDDEESTDELTLVTLTAEKYYPSNDVTLYPVYTREGTIESEVSDEITQSTTGLATSGSTGYTAWSNKTETSDAVYAGQSNKGVAFLQLRNSSPSGIISTSSGGILKKVIVAWKTSGTPSNTNGRYVTIFGKTSAYSECANLYDNSKKGTSLGNITYGTSTELDNLNKDNDYGYVGILASAAVYINTITITWLVEEDATFYYSYPSCCTPLGSINGSITLSNADNNVTASSWTATSGGNETGYLVKLYNSDKSSVLASGNTGNKATKTYTFSNPGAGTYWVSVTPTYSGAGNYCSEGTETFSASSIVVSGNVTVTFKKNGGSGTDNQTQSIPYNSSTALNTVSTIGYTAPSCKQFKGWAISEANANAGTIAYTDGDDITVTEATTLWASWEDITYTVSDGTMTGVASHSYSANPITCGTTLTITCAADGTHKDNPTVTATGTHGAITVVSATSVTIANVTSAITVNISYAAKETATVKLHVAGSTSTISGTRYEGDSYELPSTAAECPDMGLYGWYTTDYEHATTAPSGANFKLPGASATLEAGDNDFYAVYATVTPDAANTYTEITSVGQLVTGDYLIGAGSSGGYCMSNYITSSHMAERSMSVDDGVVTNSSYSDLIWHITKSGDNYTFYNAAAEKYLALSTASTPVLQASVHNFTASYTSSSWLFSSTTVSGYQLAYYVATSYFESSTTKGWNIHLFKRDPSVAGPYTTTPSCVTHDLTVVASPVGGGTATAVLTVLGEGKTTTAEATPNSHYTFSHWTISGTEASMSNTVDNKSTDNPVTVTMGTADATLTAHFTEKEHCTVVFKNNGGTESSTTYWLGEHPVAPTLTDGTSGDACDATSDKHFGWTQTAWSNTLEQAAIDAKTDADVKVYAKDATLPAITAGDDGTTITYHAVWSKVTGGTTTISIDGDGLQAVVEDQTSGYDDFDFSVGGYTFHVSAAMKCSHGGAASGWFQLKKNNDAITIPTLPGKITNISSTAIKNATSGSVSTGVYFNSSATTSEAIASETLSSATSFSLDVTGNNSSGYLLFGAATCINQLSVTYSTASYSKYLTTCCENIVEAPTVTGTPTKNSITLSWTNVTGATGYTVTSSGGTPGDVTSDGIARSCVITGLSPNTNYTWSVVATYTTPYCLANTANGNTTTSQVYAVSYNKNGGTIANLPSGGTYAAGEEVTVAAKPDGTVSKGGYTFTGWNTANDGSGEHYDADGTKSFTMPSEAVTLYAEWTAKKYYYVDRMHGNSDGVHTIEIGGVNYGCYIGEAQHTTPDPSDNSTGSNSCITGHSHFLGWVISTSIGAQGQLVSGYTIIAGGTEVTAGTDGRIYYAVWAEE